MIPKIVHYCWFGRGQMPELALKCIESWRKYLPDYELRLWNEASFSQILSPQEGGEDCWLKIVPPYVKEAYEVRKFAFVTDYVRLWALEREGGVYMDVDFEVYRPFDELMEQYDAFAGYEGSKRNPVMMGVLAAKAHHPSIQGMLQTYADRAFVLADGMLDMTPNTGYFLEWMLEHGFVNNGKEQDFMGVHILPVECFCPVLTTGEDVRSDRTYCEHKGLHSWSGNGGWKAKVLSILPQSWKTNLIKLKRRIIG